MGIKINRRDLMKTAVAGVGAGALGVLGGRKVRAAAEASTAKGATIKVAGYDYDRVRAIMDGQAGMEGAEVNFNVENIYAANKYAFDPEGKYEVTELGLIPYIVKYINEDFRAYTPIPVFI